MTVKQNWECPVCERRYKTTPDATNLQCSFDDAYLIRTGADPKQEQRVGKVCNACNRGRCVCDLQIT